MTRHNDCIRIVMSTDTIGQTLVDAQKQKQTTNSEMMQNSDTILHLSTVAPAIMTSMEKKQPIVHVASKSFVKLDAVRNILPEIYSIQEHDSKSGVDEQPVGMEMIQQGALNRLKNVKYLPCVAFETGLISTAEGYQDISCVILRTHLGDFYGWSFDRMQRCNEDDIITWLALSKEDQKTTTVGTIVSKRINGTLANLRPNTANDWYVLVGGAYSRTFILSQIFTAVWVEFVRNCEMMPVLDVSIVQHNSVPFIDIQQNLATQADDLAKCVKILTERLLFDVVVVADARGFLLAGEFMKHNNLRKIVMARKPGKLPTEVCSIKYKKEYGYDEICITKNAIPPNSHVLILDDVIGTLGTMRAIQQLVEMDFNSTVVAFVAPFAIETSPGELMCKNDMPLEKIRFAQTQLRLPQWTSRNDDDTYSNKVCIVPPSLHTFRADRAPRASIMWKQFNSSSNIKLKGNEFDDKDVIVYLNATNEAEMYEVLSIMKILYRKHPRTIQVVVPFSEHGSQDRVEIFEDGFESLAQIDTLAKMIGKHRVTTFDLHALQSALIFHDLQNVSLVQKLWSNFHNLHPNAIAVFPDDGASKRYAKLLGVADKCLTFRKTRGSGDERKVETEDPTIDGQEYAIIDDFCRSSMTLKTVAQYLLQNRKAKTVSALFAHAPFEPKCCRNLEVFGDNIWTTNSVVDKVPSKWVRIKF